MNGGNPMSGRSHARGGLPPRVYLLPLLFANPPHHGGLVRVDPPLSHRQASRYRVHLGQLQSQHILGNLCVSPPQVLVFEAQYHQGH